MFIIGLAFVAAGFLCMMFGMHNKVMTVMAFVFTVTGVVFGRSSFRGLMRIAAFDRAKDKELEKPEAVFSGGGIPQEEYYA